MTYEEFLINKIPRSECFGFEPSTAPHHGLYPHAADIARWCCRGGRRAVFAAFGLHKTRIHLQVARWIVEHTPGKKYLFVTPLGVRQGFIRDDGPAMGMKLNYCKTDSEIDASDSRFVLTNYERVRDGGVTIDDRFAGAGLDESSILRSFGTKTYQTFLPLFKAVPYRFVFTATPSPNRHKELIHYGGFLGIMDTGQALTRFFQRDSEKAGNLTLYPHMEEQFWLWIASWAVFMQMPSDLGYSDDGFVLPPVNVEWHCVSVDHKQAWRQLDSWGQRQLFLDKSAGLRDTAEVKRETMVARLSAALDIMRANDPKKHWLLWHDLEDERRLIERVLPKELGREVKTVYGSQDLEEREQIVQDFSEGRVEILATKPILAGSGCNFQRHCSDAIFLGVGYKFNDFIQAVHRLQRFQQPNQVNIHIIYSESEDPVVASLKRKWAQHVELVAKMRALLKTFKLDLRSMEIKRSIGCNRKEVSGKLFRAIHNDTVLELPEWLESSVDEIVTSIPFGNQYEYSPSINDFGHNPDNGAFFEQLDYMIPSLLRVLKPGRLACIHVKDRIRFGNVTGKGVPTVDRFSDKTADCFEKHGFNFMGRITVDTDVVRENNQTYRLGWTENSKDSSKMGVGCAEYVLLLRKPQSDTSKAYADFPVTKSKEIYMRSDWQIDASELWKSSGNRLPDTDLLVNMPMDAMGRLWREHCRSHVYDYNEHVNIAKGLEQLGRLPATFMLFPPISNNPSIWTDIARMRVLNSEQEKRNEEKHVCPLQLDIVDRLINRYSNPGEIVFDPFAGIGTVPYRAVHLGRIGWGCELSEDYWHCMVGYCEQAELQHDAPTLFDIQEFTGKVIVD